MGFINFFGFFLLIFCAYCFFSSFTYSHYCNSSSCIRVHLLFSSALNELWQKLIEFLKYVTFRKWHLEVRLLRRLCEHPLNNKFHWLLNWSFSSLISLIHNNKCLKLLIWHESLTDFSFSNQLNLIQKTIIVSSLTHSTFTITKGSEASQQYLRSNFIICFNLSIIPTRASVIFCSHFSLKKSLGVVFLVIAEQSYPS